MPEEKVVNLTEEEARRLRDYVTRIQLSQKALVAVARALVNEFSSTSGYNANAALAKIGVPTE